MTSNLRAQSAPWATVTVTLHGAPIAAPPPHTRGPRQGAARGASDLPDADACDRLEAMGGLLADAPGVTGVETRDPLSPGGPDAPQLVVYTDPENLEAVQARAQSLGDDLGLATTVQAEIRTDDDWLDGWRDHYRPLVFGRDALLLRPSWIPREDHHPALEIVLDPGRAFGTGLHETTRLCLEYLCRLAKDGAAPRSALDLGCGSGVLALAAARLFPSLQRLIAVDVDPEACATTAENAALNGLADRLGIVTGTVDQVNGAPFDLLIANIRPEVLIPAAPSLADRVSPGGSFVLSGILVEEGDAVARAYAATALDIAGRRVESDWTALEGTRD